DEKFSSSPPSLPMAMTTNAAGASSPTGAPWRRRRSASAKRTAASRQASAKADSSRATSPAVPNPTPRAPQPRTSRRRTHRRRPPRPQPPLEVLAVAGAGGPVLDGAGDQRGRLGQAQPRVGGQRRQRAHVRQQQLGQVLAALQHRRQQRPAGGVLGLYAAL